MLNKVYIACLYANRKLAQEAARELRAAGYQITSRWLYGETDTAIGFPHQEAAVRDLKGVAEADYLMLLTLPFGTMYSGGGRHVEFGYALALGKRMIVVGDFETIFCHLPNVSVYPTVGVAINFMELER